MTPNQSPLDPLGDVADAEAQEREAEQATKEAEEQERKQVGQLLGLISKSRKKDKDERERWEKWRSYVAGEPEDEDGDARTFMVDAPLLQSVMESTLAGIYAQDPDVSAVPEQAVSEASYEDVRQFGQTLQVVLSRMLKDGKCKRAVKRASRSAMTNCIGWVKPMLQLDKRTDPIIKAQIADVQDNMMAIDRLMAEIGDPSQCTDLEAKKAELKDQVRSLRDQLEIQVARGAVIDFLRADDVQVDGECAEIEDYEQADWIAQREFMTPDKVVETYKIPKDKLQGAAIFKTRDEAESASKVSEDGAGKGLIAVWEMWHRKNGTVYTMAEGCKCFLRPPYSPNPVSRRFYPFFALAFHWVDQRRWPRSDVDLGHKLQEEASRSLSQFAEHRRRCRPKSIFNKHMLGPEDVSAIQNAEGIELVGVSPTSPDAEVSRMIASIAYPAVDPGLYDIGPYRQAMEELFGQQDASRGGIVRPKTATEAGIAEEGRQSRMDWRRDAIEEMLTDMAWYLAELAMQAMPLEEAQKYAGMGAVWPELSKDEIFTMLRISIRAGSSGKPNTASEREAWATLMPLISAEIKEIAGLMANPMTKPLADVKIELLKESVRRLDDRIDVTRFLPKMPVMPAAPVPGAESGDNVIPLLAQAGVPAGLPA